MLPFFLNLNYFEQSLKKQEIVLDGAEFRMDENKNKETRSDVGINRYILKRSYELFERIIKKYFNEKLYEENYMKNKIGILYKYPIIYGINNIYFPIYDNYNHQFTKNNYVLVK